MSAPSAVHSSAPLLARSLRDLLGLVLPDGCAGCGARDREAVCPCCAEFLRGPATRADPTPAPPGLPPVWAVAAYDGPVRPLLAAYKERGRRSLAAPLGTALARSMLAAGEGAPPLVVVPVPSSPASVRRRGRDTGAELARRGAALARRSGSGGPRVGPLAPVLRLRRRVRDSAGLSAVERAANLADAYAVPRRLAPLVAGRAVLLVDDVATTGASLAEATRALERAGGAVVACAVVAVTPRRAAYPHAGEGD